LWHKAPTMLPGALYHKL